MQANNNSKAKYQLDVKAVDAILKRDTELFGQMDPFVQIEIGEKVQRTTAHKKGGKKPNFNGEILRFQIKDEVQMKVTVFDEEAFKSKHDLVGEATIDLAKILAGEVEQMTIELKYGKNMNKKAGDVNL